MKKMNAKKTKTETKTKAAKPLRIRAGIKAGKAVFDRPGGGC